MINCDATQCGAKSDARCVIQQDGLGHTRDAMRDATCAVAFDASGSSNDLPKSIFSVFEMRKSKFFSTANDSDK